MLARSPLPLALTADAAWPAVELVGTTLTKEPPPKTVTRPNVDADARAAERIAIPTSAVNVGPDRCRGGSGAGLALGSGFVVVGHGSLDGGL